MKANEFVKKFGWDKVKSIVLDFNYNSSNKFIVNLTDNSAISIYDLKRLVESYELVESFGGLEGAKDKYYSCVQNYETSSHISRAIEDVESCI